MISHKTTFKKTPEAKFGQKETLACPFKKKNLVCIKLASFVVYSSISVLSSSLNVQLEYNIKKYLTFFFKKIPKILHYMYNLNIMYRVQLVNKSNIFFGILKFKVSHAHFIRNIYINIYIVLY